MIPTPKMLRRSGDRAIIIQWSDGARREYTFQELRDACPCASCREKRSQPSAAASGSGSHSAMKNLLPVLSLAEARPLSISRMDPVGNYAYSIEFSDGHSTGIYTLELLRQLGRDFNAEESGQPAK